jgi:hypothetical protein
VAILALGWAIPVAAAPVPPVCRAKHKVKPRRLLKSKAAAQAEAKAKASAAIAAGKAAVFEFKGEDTEAVRRRVVKALRAHGMSVMTNLKAPDTPDQFRDMSVALRLAVYVHGEIRDLSASRSTLTVMVRSGVTGRKVASLSVSSPRSGLASELDEVFWERVESAIGRACLAAEKPGRRIHRRTHINAGTPIADSEPESTGT